MGFAVELVEGEGPAVVDLLAEVFQLHRVVLVVADGPVGEQADVVVWVVAVGVGVGGLGGSDPAPVAEPGDQLLPTAGGDHGRPGRQRVVEGVLGAVGQGVGEGKGEEQGEPAAVEVGADDEADVSGLLGPDLACALHAPRR